MWRTQLDPCVSSGLQSWWFAKSQSHDLALSHFSFKNVWAFLPVHPYGFFCALIMQDQLRVHADPALHDIKIETWTSSAFLHQFLILSLIIYRREWIWTWWENCYNLHHLIHSSLILYHDSSQSILKPLWLDFSHHFHFHIQADQYCYHLSITTMTWLEARDYCIARF